MAPAGWYFKTQCFPHRHKLMGAQYIWDSGELWVNFRYLSCILLTLWPVFFIFQAFRAQLTTKNTQLGIGQESQNSCGWSHSQQTVLNKCIKLNYRLRDDPKVSWSVNLDGFPNSQMDYQNTWWSVDWGQSFGAQKIVLGTALLIFNASTQQICVFQKIF